MGLVFEKQHASTMSLWRLRRRVTGTVSTDCKPGPSTVLTSEEETRLTQFLIEVSDMGFGLSREDVMKTAFSIVSQAGRAHSFQNGAAGRSWFDAFKRRHPNLTLRTPQPLSSARAAGSNKEVIEDFFAKLGGICARLNLLAKPMRINWSVRTQRVTGLEITRDHVSILGGHSSYSCTWL